MASGFTERECTKFSDDKANGDSDILWNWLRNQKHSSSPIS